MSSTKRQYAPPATFVAQANINDPAIYEKAAISMPDFWAQQARQLHWFKQWHTILNWQPPHAKWFDGGLLNASVNCLDRHVNPALGYKNRRQKKAIIWEGEPGDQRVLTYQTLYQQVNRFANVLKKLQIKKGERVILYLPMIPELIVACLACARVGAIHSVVFAGLGSDALKLRIQDLDASLVITADNSWRRGRQLKTKSVVDRAVKNCPSVRHVITVNRTNPNKAPDCPMTAGRDLAWNELIKNSPDYCPPARLASEDILFVLYTSGTTGPPKGIVHTTGGYLTQVNTTTRWVFDIKETDVYWCTADIGWITGHSYVIYGPLMNGATIFIYEGAPDFPDQNRMWRIIAKHKVSILYTAPTLLRMFMTWKDCHPLDYNLGSLRLLGSVGEPINPTVWNWYYEQIGRSRCPVVDTWWQTETGAIMIAPLPGISTTLPGSATKPLPGISASVLNTHGLSEINKSGYLAIKHPWPSMARTIWRDDQRFIDNYWSKWDHQTYFTGDSASLDNHGNFWLSGRVDDLIQVSGHRVSSTETENALVSHPAVTEAAVIGQPHPVKGAVIIAFVTLSPTHKQSPALAKKIIEHVADKAGPICKPAQIIFTNSLPKTRSGKIMRRLLRNIAAGQPIGNTATLANPESIKELSRL